MGVLWYASHKQFMKSHVLRNALILTWHNSSLRRVWSLYFCFNTLRAGPVSHRKGTIRRCLRIRILFRLVFICIYNNLENLKRKGINTIACYYVKYFCSMSCSLSVNIVCSILLYAGCLSCLISMYTVNENTPQIEVQLIYYT